MTSPLQEANGGAGDSPALKPDDRVLILDISNLENLHHLSTQLQDGLLVGIGTPDEVHAARKALAQNDNVMFHPATPDEIPWREAYFTAIITHLAEPTPELHRVLAPQGRFIALSDL